MRYDAVRQAKATDQTMQAKDNSGHETRGIVEPTERERVLAARLERRPDVRRAVATWSGCDVAVLVPDGVDLVPIINGYEVVDVEHYGAAPYNLLKLNEVDDR